MLEDSICVLVRYPDKTEVWEDLREYEANPPVGSYIIRDSRKVPMQGEKK